MLIGPSQTSSVASGPKREVIVRPTPDGGFALGAVDQRMSSATYRPLLWLAKLDASGVETWQYAYGDLWMIDGTLNALELASDGGYVLAGVDQGEALVVKVASDGTLLWARWYGDAFGGANAATTWRWSSRRPRRMGCPFGGRRAG